MPRRSLVLRSVQVSNKKRYEVRGSLVLMGELKLVVFLMGGGSWADYRCSVVEL